MDGIVYKTQNFTVKAPEVPHVPREDGGHVFIEANDPHCCDRTQLTADQAIECAWLTMLAGEAYWNVMSERGLDPYRLNYQDNGNWAFVRGEDPLFHIHIYGRARNEKHQEYGQALRFPYPTTGFYEGFQPLTDDDIAALAARMDELAASEKYGWGPNAK